MSATCTALERSGAVVVAAIGSVTGAWRVGQICRVKGRRSNGVCHVHGAGEIGRGGRSRNRIRHRRLARRADLSRQGSKEQWCLPRARRWRDRARWS